MWLIRWIFVTALLLALAGFLGLNLDEKVDVNFLFWKSPPIALSFALFIAFALGIFVHLVISILRQFQLRSEISRQKRQIQRLQDELERLRNLPIEEELIAQQVSANSETQFNSANRNPNANFPSSYSGDQ